MTKVIKTFEASSCAAVWLDAVTYVRDEIAAYNVVLGVERPLIVGARDAAIQQHVNRFLETHEKEPLATVATNIFPGSEYLHGGASEVFNDFPNVLPKIRGRWDGYAARMLARSIQRRDGSKISPLEQMVEKMKKQANRPGPMRSVYDISIDDPADPLTDIAIYHADQDAAAIHPPCLMHLSFKLVKKKVYLTVLYRTHFFIEKVLGNLIGLAQLQSFVADQLGPGFEPGPFVCHSTYAVFDFGTQRRKADNKLVGWTQEQARSLIDECLAIAAPVHDSSTEHATA
jgi:hypothetical protein